MHHQENHRHARECAPLERLELSIAAASKLALDVPRQSRRIDRGEAVQRRLDLSEVRPSYAAQLAG